MPNLTELQKKRLSILEPVLKKAVQNGAYAKAESILADIQSILRKTGHETRLMQSKNLVFEAAMNAGNIDFAKSGFISVRGKVSPRTRLYLEATALLAICYIKEMDLESAAPFMNWVLSNCAVIRTRTKQVQFRRETTERFMQEALLAGLRKQGNENIVIEDIKARVEKAIRTKTEDEMFADIGNAIPKGVVDFMLQVDELSKKQLPPADIKLLPPKQELTEPSKLGRSIFGAVQRVIYGALCDPENDLYQKLIRDGLDKVIDTTKVATIFTALLTDAGIAVKTVIVTATAIAVKIGIKVYCEHNKPKRIMELRDEK